MVKDLWNFVKAVWRHGARALTGGGIAVTISFFDHLVGDFKWVFWLLSGLALFIAVFYAWRDERHEREDERHKREMEIAELNQKMALSDLINRQLGVGHFLKVQFLDGTMAQCNDQTTKQMLRNWLQDTNKLVYEQFGEDVLAKFSLSSQEIPDSKGEQERWIDEQSNKLWKLTQQIHHMQSITHIKANRD